MAPTRKSKPKPEPQPSRMSERLQLTKAIEDSKKDTKGVSKRKRFRRPRQRKSCHLFKLPGELRNQIYAHALVSPTTIDITPKGPGEPPLLRVCKGIRDETRSIYYAENRFKLKVVKFNGGDFTKWAYQYQRYEPLPPKATNVTFDLDSQPNWQNLVRWVKDDYYGSGMRPDFTDPVRNSDYICGAAFKLADAIGARMGPFAWVTVEKALEAFHHGLKGTCSQWAREEDEDGVH